MYLDARAKKKKKKSTSVCACLCVSAQVKPAALLCWPGHVATLKLLSERPVKLLRSSTTLAVGSGNPSASCSLHTHTHTPSLLHSHLPGSHVPPLMPPLARFSCDCSHLRPPFLPVIVCPRVCFLFCLPPNLPFALFVPHSDRRICIIYVVKHHCGPSVSAGTRPAAHVSSCIPAQIAGNALWQQTQSHV